MDATAKLSELLNHKYVRLTNRGNSGIKHAFKVVKEVSDKKCIFIPDQGGWITYEPFAKKLGFEVKKIKTDLAYFTADDIDPNSCAAIILTQPAGYFAGLDLKSIYQKCKGKCILIADVSGSVGDKSLTDGKYADIMVGSFSEWKPVDVGYGGFISFKDKKLYEVSKKIELPEFSIEYEKELLDKLTTLPDRYDFLYSQVNEIKKAFEDFDIIYPEKKGLVVVVKFKNNKEKQNIIKYCDENNFEYTLCPRYIRVNENAVSIEIKRLVKTC